MATLGPQIVTGSYGNLLKFIDAGEAGVTTSQVQITDGKGKVTPLQLATGSVYVSGTLSSSAEVVFNGLTPNAPGQYVSFDTTTGRLYYSTTSSIQNVVSASYAVSAAFAPNDGDWTIGSTFMTASGKNSIVIGNKLENGLDNHAQGDWSHAEGANTVASGSYSHAEGRNTSASGDWSHAEGNKTLASGIGSHAEGQYTTASGDYSHAEGLETLASLPYSHAEGIGTTASQWGAHAEGSGSIASAAFSHAEGLETLASDLASHAEGKETIASGELSHAEGNKTLASGIGSHAEGQFTTASGDYSHAEGYQSYAGGEYSHAEGDNGFSQGDYSHAGGLRSTAKYDHQTVVGHYNDAQVDKPEDVFVVGVGTDTNTRQSGLRVRKPEGKVILNQIATNTDPVVFGLLTPFLDAFASTIPTAPGLHFGEPEVAGTTRIVSSLNINNLQGVLTLQHHNGTQYDLMIQAGGDVVFIPDP